MHIKNNGIKIVLLGLLLINISINAQENGMDHEFAGKTITKPFGSFLLPKDCTEITRYSRNGKYFYSHKTEQIGSTMTNISVEIGTNTYVLEDHMAFRYAILRQLLMQTAAAGAEVQGSGTFTNHDDPLYIFTILEKEPPVTTIQYYIIGNKRHILVHVTDFHNKNITNAKEVAQFIVDSFVWSD
jgi:hypothetical protein